MKKVTIDWSGTDSPVNSIYASTGVKFSWLASGKNKDEFLQVTKWHSCRETFTAEMCRFVSKKPPMWKLKRDLDLKKTRVAVVRRHSVKEFVEGTKSDLKWMKCSARLLNIFEKNQGWALTRVCMCDDIDLHKNSINTFVFNSSAKWQQAPQMLSLYLLIIRLGRFHKEFSKFKKVTDLESVAKLFSGTKNSVFHEDIMWFELTWKYWMLMLNNHDAIFFSKSLEENFRENTGAQGIKNLINGSADQKILTIWNKIVKENAKTTAPKIISE